MTELLPTLLTFPPEKEVLPKQYDTRAREFINTLESIPTQAWLKNLTKQNILDMLNPSLNSLAYIFALHAQCSAVGKDRAKHEEAYTRAIVFFTSFDPIQVRYAGEQWRQLLDWCFETSTKLSVRDFTPLTTAMLCLDPSAGTFTSSHLRIVRLCLEAGVPSQALPIIDKDICAYPQKTEKNLTDDLLCENHELSNTYITTKSGFSLELKSSYILEYYLLSATIYIGLRNYPRARLFLETCLLTPTTNHITSVLQVEAHKKWLLIALLAQGKSYGLPRTHDPAVIRSLRANSKPYEALSESFEKRDWRKFQAEVDVGVQVWHDDGNLRLVKEVGDALLRFRVVDLQRTFAALPVGRVARHLEMPVDGTLQILDDMIRTGNLQATIAQSSQQGGEAVLQFSPSTSSVPTDNSEPDLAAQTARIQALTTYIRDADRRLQLTKEFVEVQRRNKRNAAAGVGGGAGFEGDPADQMDLTWDAPIAGLDDEELGDDFRGEGMGGFGVGGGGGLGEDEEEDVMGS